MIKEVATKNDIKEVAMENMAKVIDQRCLESSTLVLETWAVASENQRETQETEGGDEEAKVGADAHDGNIATDNDIGPKMARMSKDHGEDSSTLVLETSAVASESQHETEEMEGGYEEAKDEANVCDEETKRSTMTKAYVHNKEAEESMTMDNDGQASQENLKGVRRKVIMSSNMREDTSMKIKGMMVNSNARVYHNKWMKERHAIWSLRDPDMSIRLKGLRWVVSIDIQIWSCEGKQGTRKNERSKFLDQGDRQDKGGTNTNCERLCSGGAKGDMTTGHSFGKCERMIWWIGWRRWFGWKEWTSSKWRDKDGASKA
mgnify:CR=1 FL=1